MRPLRVGVIGLGLGKLHVAALQEEAAVGRVAICDADRSRLEAVRGEHRKVEAAYTDLETMLRSEGLDAVSIATPDHLHRPHAEACLGAGCHVLLTKPLASNLEDGRAIVRAAEASGRKLMVAHERRFQTLNRKIKALLDAGTLGEIIHLRLDEFSDKREQFRRSPWYASTESGRTAMSGTGIHQVDLMRYWVGRPVEAVCAYGNALGELKFPGDKTTVAIFRFAGGVVGQVTASYVAFTPPSGALENSQVLLSTQGLLAGQRWASSAQAGWQDLPCDEHPIRTGSFGCVREFVRAIVEDQPAAVSGREAFASLAACVAADESAATGRPAVPAAADFI